MRAPAEPASPGKEPASPKGKASASPKGKKPASKGAG